MRAKRASPRDSQPITPPLPFPPSTPPRLPLALRGVGFSHPFIPTFYSCRPLSLPPVPSSFTFRTLEPHLTVASRTFMLLVGCFFCFFLARSSHSFAHWSARAKSRALSSAEGEGATPALITSYECSCLGRFASTAQCQLQTEALNFHQSWLCLMFMYFFFFSFILG